eukprot:570337-Prymnesium_polylepis.4
MHCADPLSECCPTWQLTQASAVSPPRTRLYVDTAASKSTQERSANARLSHLLGCCCTEFASALAHGKRLQCR